MNKEIINPGLHVFNDKYQVQIEQLKKLKIIRATLISGGGGEADPIELHYNDDDEVKSLILEARNLAYQRIRNRQNGK